MPLRDHFRPPLHDVHSWDELHGGWPMTIVQEDVMTFLNVDPALGSKPPSMYAATLRMRYEDRRRMMDNWYDPLTIGQPLPTLPIWLTETSAISLELESSYEETCRALRIR